MKQKIDIFLPAESIADIMPMLDKLNKERMIDSIFMISSTEEETMAIIEMTPMMLLRWNKSGC